MTENPPHPRGMLHSNRPRLIRPHFPAIPQPYRPHLDRRETPRSMPKPSKLARSGPTYERA
jgi:hypothetical protein